MHRVKFNGADETFGWSVDGDVCVMMCPVARSYARSGITVL